MITITIYDSGAKSHMNKVSFLIGIHLDEKAGEIRSNDRMSLANRTQDEFFDLEALFRLLWNLRCIN